MSAYDTGFVLGQALFWGLTALLVVRVLQALLGRR